MLFDNTVVGQADMECTMADQNTWDTPLSKRDFGRVFSIKLHKNSSVSHKVNIILRSDGTETPKALAESLLGKRVINVQNTSRQPAGQSEEDFAAKCKALNGKVFPLVPTGAALQREPTAEEAIDILSRAIDDGTLTKDNASPTLVAKLKERGIVLK